MQELSVADARAHVTQREYGLCRVPGLTIRFVEENHFRTGCRSGASTTFNRMLSGPKIPRLPPDRRRALCHIDGRQPLAALVAHVINDALVNLAVLDSNGMSHSRTSIPHEQGGEAKPEHGYFCSWIPTTSGRQRSGGT